jgi:hypothetical protein
VQEGERDTVNRKVVGSNPSWWHNNETSPWLSRICKIIAQMEGENIMAVNQVFGNPRLRTVCPLARHFSPHCHCEWPRRLPPV